ncbi:hypothetical protein OFB63_32280, partial [Escherichia coli]|nr:hypothetical protein [Escherichia coli]
CGQKNWYAITSDKNISKNTIEKRAIESAGVGAFILANNNNDSENKVNLIIQVLNQICKIIYKHKCPFIARITGSGKVVLVNTKSSKQV